MLNCGFGWALTINLLQRRNFFQSFLSYSVRKKIPQGSWLVGNCDKTFCFKQSQTPKAGPKAPPQMRNQGKTKYNF